MRTHRQSTARGAIVATVAMATAAGLAACSGPDEAGVSKDDFTYVLDRPLTTTNAAGTLGVASDAAALSARLYPGAFLPGPGGRLLPNTDLVTATPDPENPDAVDYAVTDGAAYSDGAPVVCDDFLLAWVAAHRTDLFASEPGLMTRVRDVTCAAGERSFRVDFDEGFGARYRELFGAGEVLPSHTVAEHAGVDSVVDAVNTGDVPALTALGQSWSTTFDLAATDPATVPTSGPFRIESREDEGNTAGADRGPVLILGRNPEWRGDRPGLDRIVVRGGGDTARAVDGTAEVTDAAVLAGQPTDADFTAAGLTVSRVAGVRSDGLTLSDAGVFATADNRRAFASCIDRSAVVEAVATATGATVEPQVLRVATPGSPASEALADLAARLGARDPRATAAVLDGTTVRIGYLAGQPRLEVIVGALAASCAESGVTVVGVPLDVAALQRPGGSGTDYDALLDTRTPYSRNPRVTVSPASRSGRISDAENQLATDAATIPLAVEPRLVLTASTVSGVSDSGGEQGLSWNMDRWTSTDHPLTEDPDTSEETE